MADFSDYDAWLIGDRPKRSVDPKIHAAAWSDTRADLCEALPYFHNTQGGVYHKDHTMFGALLDNYGGKRSYMNAEVVITRLPGATPGTILQSLKDINKTMGENTPVVLILGHDGKTETAAPVAFPEDCRYAVMDDFYPVDFWQEQVQDKVGRGMRKNTIIVRYQLANLMHTTWWDPLRPDPPPLNERHFTEKPDVVERICRTCQRSTPKRYVEMWFCGNPDCKNVGTDNGADTPDDMNFDQKYLMWRAPPVEHEATVLAPNRFNERQETLELKKGSVCDECRKCGSRYRWNSWACTNTNCGKSVALPPLVPTIPEVLEEQPKRMNRNYKRLSLNDEVYFRSEALVEDKLYRLYSIDLPRGIGSVTLFHPKPTDPHVPDFADGIWTALTGDAEQGVLDLQRWRLQKGAVTGLRINHFEANYGEPYNFKVLCGSTPFDRSAPVIHGIMDIVRKAARAMAQQVPQPAPLADANELLLVGYGQEQLMNFHTDGEEEVGATITTVSVGGPARMEFRYTDLDWRHAKKYKVIPNTKIRDDDGIRWRPEPGDPWPGSLHYQAVQDIRAGASPGDPHELIDAAVYEQISMGQKSGGTSEVYLEMDLLHGSIVIMHGKQIASHFQHKVEPSGQMRFAATAREMIPVEKKEPGTKRKRKTDTSNSPDDEGGPGPSTKKSRGSNNNKPPPQSGPPPPGGTLSPPEDVTGAWGSTGKGKGKGKGTRSATVSIQKVMGGRVTKGTRSPPREKGPVAGSGIISTRILRSSVKKK